MKRWIGIIFLPTLFGSILVLTAGCDSSTSTVAPTNTTTLVSTMVNDFNRVNSAESESSNGLRLSLFLDAKTYKQGLPIHMVVSERNMLTKTNRMPIAAKWPANGLSLGICGTRGLPFGVAIFQGDYTVADISTLTSFVFFNPNIIVNGCLPFLFTVTAYNFRPSSDIATAESYRPDESSTIQMSSEVMVIDYWTGSFPDAVPRYFEPGVYTVIAGDEWGTLVILHFTIEE